MLGAFVDLPRFASDSESEDASPRRRPEVTRSGSSDEDWKMWRTQ